MLNANMQPQPNLFKPKLVEHAITTTTKLPSRSLGLYSSAQERHDIVHDQQPHLELLPLHDLQRHRPKQLLGHIFLDNQPDLLFHSAIVHDHRGAQPVRPAIHQYIHDAPRQQHVDGAPDLYVSPAALRDPPGVHQRRQRRGDMLL
jgi:hypothetical protein